MPLPVGIDLGTTNSVISVYRRGRTEALLVDGAASMPSAVCFRDSRSILVGSKALGMAMIRPESTVLSVKRKMGDADAKFNLEGKTLTPVDISAQILGKLCEGHDAVLGGAPRDAVITVPAYFTDAQRKDTKLAGERAGLNVLRLLPEPTAAAIAIGLDKGRDQTILVYDLGGGTFDVSILKVQDNSFSVLAVNGDHDLGGNDFDAAIRNYALDAFKVGTAIDLMREDPGSTAVRKAMQSLTVASERAKMELSYADESYLDLPNLFGGKHLALTITRSTFETLIYQLIMRTTQLVLSTIQDAKLDVDDIDRLVLVGGSTKVPLVANVLAKTVKEPYIADNVDLAVSAGAAIMAANLHSVDEAGAVSPDYSPVEITVTDVVAHPISLGVSESIGSNLICVEYLRKNTPLPAHAMKLLGAMPLQIMAKLPIYRGNNRMPSNNVYLGELTATIPMAFAITGLLMKISLDIDGVLQCEVLILDAGHDELLSLSRQEEQGTLNPDALRVKGKAQVEIKLPD